jgi:hypothetical protein
MKKRVKMSRKASKKVFKKFSGTHAKNTTSYVMRGGIRM